MAKEENGIVDVGARDMSKEEQLVFVGVCSDRCGCLFAATEIDPKPPTTL